MNFRITLDESDEEIIRKMRRVSGQMVCKKCNRYYIDHPMISNLLDSNDVPYLHYTCEGLIVKL